MLYSTVNTRSKVQTKSDEWVYWGFIVGEIKMKTIDAYSIGHHEEAGASGVGSMSELQCKELYHTHPRGMDDACTAATISSYS